VTKINWEGLRADIGGKWFINRKSLLPLVPYLIITSVLNSGYRDTSEALIDPNPTSRIAALVVANVFSILICWAYLELASKTIFRNRDKVSANVFLVLFFSGTVGFLKGSTTGLFSWILGSELVLEQAVSSRVFQTTLLGVWTLPIIALLAATFARYKNERDLLVIERVKAGLKSNKSSAQDPDRQALAEFLSQSKTKLQDASIGNGQEPKEIAKTLRALIEEGLRPLSHRMFQREQEQEARFSLRDLTLLALAKNPFPLRIIAAGFVIGLLPINLLAFGWMEALGRTAMYVIIITLVFASWRALKPVRPLPLVGVFVMGNLTAGFLAPILTEVAFGPNLALNASPAWVALFLWLAQLSLFASVVNQVLSTRDEIREELYGYLGKNGLDNAVRSATNKITSRDLAQYVHSNLQNKLLASALKLDSDNISKEELQQHLTQIQLLLDGALESYQTESTSSLEQGLQEVTSRWQGFVSMNLDVELPGIQLDANQTKLVIQVVSEAISNSVRHGLASNVSIRVALSRTDNSQIVITVSDDGLGPRSGKAGLGNELFQAVSEGNWNIQNSESGGSLFTLQMNV
jgi:two-component sensor histidine kinase